MENNSASRKYTCRPALVTTALFVSLFIVDLIRQEYVAIVGHALLGVLSILLVNVLCQNNMPFAAWGLLATPFILLAIGYLIFLVQRAAAAPAPLPAPPLKPVAPAAPTPAPVSSKEPACCPPPPNPYKYYV
jgi:hypothetical protein